MMPSTSTLGTIRERATTQRNVTILTAILVAVPVAYAFHLWSDAQQGEFLLLMILAVGVPTAFDDFHGPFDRTWKALLWILAACAVVTVEFVGLYVVSTDALGQSPFLASVGAFLVTTMLNLAWLLVSQRQYSTD